MHRLIWLFVGRARHTEHYLIATFSRYLSFDINPNTVYRLINVRMEKTLKLTGFTMLLIICSPEHEVLKVSYCDRPLSVARAYEVLKVSYCDRPLSVVRRPCVRLSSTFALNNFFSKTAGLILE